MMSNTYNTERGSMCGADYINYNILQLIRNDTTATYTPSTSLSQSNLFGKGSTFSMTSFSKQFVKGSSLNNGKALGWTFSVTALSSTQATIKVTKA